MFCSDATLRRDCVQCTTASFKELKEATRFRERWRFRTREIPHTLPIRHADEVARLGALSPLGGHSRDDPEEQEDSCPISGFGRAANFQEVMTAYGSWLDRQGELPALKQWRSKSAWESFAVSLQHGAILLAGTLSSREVSSSKKQFA